jgi:hypothetical protein
MIGYVVHSCRLPTLQITYYTKVGVAMRYQSGTVGEDKEVNNRRAGKGALGGAAALGRRKDAHRPAMQCTALGLGPRPR